MSEQDTVTQPRQAVPALSYEPPTVTCLGEIREVVLGTGSQDTADMNTSRYW
ncbi:putative RiPP precursor [Nocardiopsis tropica]|uniref:RiPP n=1 Tax=Nocardiopsis tropica TaxID=109330 RepID=A0ABU7KI80_9ACTN|nr:putative RiPP precursor [Nocardiopsis umidischolae]MEE2049005.1 putative RiPP precursor [Nocardiopsis umidischolae]